MKKIIILLLLTIFFLSANDFWKPFSQVLKKGVVYYNYSSVDGDFYHTGFDYKKVKNDNQLIELLKEQHQKLIEYKISSNYKRQNLSFWINAYNFFTIVDIITNYPIKSMKSEIGWKKKHHNIGGNKFSLNDIEHSIIRKYGDARIHFAINCASVGCPALIKDVFTKEKLNEQLNSVTRNALLNPLHLYKDLSKNRYWHTQLFKWFGSDFELAPYGSVENFINKFSPNKYKNISSKRSIPYDWDLNNPQNIVKKMTDIQKKYSELRIIKK